MDGYGAGMDSGIYYFINIKVVGTRPLANPYRLISDTNMPGVLIGRFVNGNRFVIEFLDGAYYTDGYFTTIGHKNFCFQLYALKLWFVFIKNRRQKATQFAPAPMVIIVIHRHHASRR